MNGTLVHPGLVRKIGWQHLLRLLVVDAGSLLVLWGLHRLGAGSWKYLFLVPICLSAPYICLAGLTATGTPLAVWEDRWRRLAAWQRGIFGTLFVLLMLLLILSTVAAIFAWLV